MDAARIGSPPERPITTPAAFGANSRHYDLPDANAANTHCIRGHFGDSRLRANGYRECLECRRMAHRDWRSAMNETTEARFWTKVHRSPTCWEWQARLNTDGYGEFSVRGKSTRAHRFSYERSNGEIPSGLVLDHLCRNRRCVRPDHLRVVTNRENVLEPLSKSLTAINERKTHCDRGHSFNDENTRVNLNGWRICLTCHRAAQRAYKARVKARRTAESQS